MDAIAGLPTRYTQMVIGVAPRRNFGQISLDALLGAAGIMLIAVADPEALERIRNRLVPLQRIDTTGGVRRKVKFNLSVEFMRKIGSLGGRKSATVVARKRYISETNRRNVMKRYRKAEV